MLRKLCDARRDNVNFAVVCKWTIRNRYSQRDLDTLTEWFVCRINLAALKNKPRANSKNYDVNMQSIYASKRNLALPFPRIPGECAEFQPANVQSPSALAGS